MRSRAPCAWLLLAVLLGGTGATAVDEASGQPPAEQTHQQLGEAGSIAEDQVEQMLAAARELRERHQELFGGAHGLLVSEVEPDGQGARVGLMVGDVLIRYGQAPLDLWEDLIDLSRGTDLRQAVRLGLLRDGSRLSVEIEGGPLGIGIRGLVESPLEVLWYGGYEADLRGRYEEALGRYLEGLRRIADGGGPARPIEALFGFNAGLAAANLARYEQSLEQARRALATSREIGDRDGEHRSLRLIGEVHDRLGRYREALEYHRRALPILREIGDRWGEANGLGTIGSVYWNLGRYTEALEHHQQALAIRREIGDHTGEASALGNIAIVYLRLGRSTEALELLRGALTIHRATGDRRGEGFDLGHIATCYSRLGRYAEALRHYQQALDISNEIGDHHFRAASSSNIGIVYWRLGRYREARNYYHQALLAVRKTGDRRSEGRVLTNIGLLSLVLGQATEALASFSEARSIEREFGDFLGESDDLDAIGIAYRHLGRLTEALEHHQRSLMIRRKLGERAGETRALGNLGTVYRLLGRYPEALLYSHQALLVASDLGDLESQWRAAFAAQRTLTALGRPREAVFFGKRAVNAIQALRGHAVALSSDLQFSLLENKRVAFDELAELLIEQGRFGEAQDAMALLKDEEYFDFIRRDAADAGTTEPIRPSAFEAPWAMRYDELSGRLASLGREWAALAGIDESVRSDEERTRYAELDAGLDAARGDFRTFLADLEAACAAADSAGRDHTAQIGHDEAAPGILEELERQNENWRAVLAHYLVTEDDVHVLVSTPEVQLARKVTIAEGDLNERIFAYLQTLQNPRADPLPQARALYDLLVAPIAGDLAQAAPRVVMLYLDGALRYLPFAALHSGDHWLIEDYALAVYTARTAQRMVSPAPSWRVAALGASRGGDGFAPLPAVPFELDGIVREEARDEDTVGVIPGVVHLDDAFTSDAFSQAVKARGRYPVVHVASHFRFAPGGTDEDSYLLLGDGGRLTLAALRTGSFPMAGVEMLALSACQTGVGGEGGTGAEVEGLAYVAQELNAKSVLATLWSVADASTGLFMRELYAARENRQLTKAEALRAAQLALLHGRFDLGALPDELRRGLEVLAPDSGAATHYIPDPAAPLAHPYYWAPFILMGNWL